MNSDELHDLVPELSCADLTKSVNFHTEILDFQIRFERPENGYCCIVRPRAQCMIEQANDHYRSAGAPLGAGHQFSSHR
ncbi:MAG: hypothetical protein ACU0C9_04465 [Paracoccaceae bacterium]